MSKQEKVVVTGVAGFIGSTLAEELLKRGYDVIGIDDLSSGSITNIPSGVRFKRIDISTAPNGLLVDTYEDSIFIFHLAALARVQLSMKDPIRYNAVNVGGTLNVLEAARNCTSRPKVIFSSSSSVYGNTNRFPTAEYTTLNPQSPYALQKQIAEQYCELYNKYFGVPVIILRYFNVYGNKMALTGAYRLAIGIFTEQVMTGKPLTINGTGENRRDFTYVGDVVDANIKAALSDIGFDIFNIGNGDNRSVNQIAALISNSVTHLPPVVEPAITLADNTYAKTKLNWNPSMKIENWMPQWLAKHNI